MTKELEQAARKALISAWAVQLEKWKMADEFKECQTCHSVSADKQKAFIERTLAEFALAQCREQLAELERRGYAGHKKGCAYIFLTCNCGWDEMKRELEEK